MACKVPPIELPPGHTFPPCNDCFISPEKFIVEIIAHVLYNLERTDDATHKVDGFLETIEKANNEPNTH